MGAVQQVLGKMARAMAARVAGGMMEPKALAAAAKATACAVEAVQAAAEQARLVTESREAAEAMQQTAASMVALVVAQEAVARTGPSRPQRASCGQCSCQAQSTIP